MSLIKKPGEIAHKETIACLIYGQSGMGKTTLACSAPAPVIFDFDNGITRVKDEYQVPTVQVSSFKEAQEALREVQAAGDEYKTIVIDTASKMIDSIIYDICGTAQPKLQQWGLVNAAFKSFLRGVQQMGKNIVFIAQREVEKDGEANRYVPQFRASNYKDVICDLDVCGYMEMVTYKGQEVRQITFNPTSRNEGKNTAEFAPAYIIHDLTGSNPNTFLTDRFAEYVSRQKEKAEKRATNAQAVNDAMEEFSNKLEQCNDAECINALLDEAKATKAVGNLRIKMSQAISKKAKALNLKLNKDKRYE